ncbi:MAG: hypothetical protein VX313_01950 [Bacteroidota bacterium]|nr:hypothetical protein [Bacteroidota bacterium]MEC7616848.1 hypothetical protein [Bacteroidota bacterium]MEC7659620.1 hypothetical protein [Bacteroidota bacterium]MED5363372.1 hypothetical protein [Bacteroidota bacterium]MEE3019994.1 hypothetical protein [Bacteroidota bacterium]
MKEYIEPLEQRAQNARWLMHVALDVLNKLDDYKDPIKAKAAAIRAIKEAMRELKQDKPQ